MERPKITFVGLGVMGLPMARNLVRAGFPVTAWSRSPEPVTTLQSEGAVGASSLAEAVARADVAITMLPDTPDVERVLTASDGIFVHAPAGCLVIEMSTINPAAARRLASTGEAAGIHVIDAPVSGGERGAIDGSLSIMVGGEEDDVERGRPVLKHLGARIVHVGAAGAGQLAKACNQLVVGANIQAVAEALELARRSGVDPESVREALLGGFAGSRVLEVHGRRMLDGDYTPGFRAALHRKDARIVSEEAGLVGAEIPAFNVVHRQLDELVRRGFGSQDHSALVLALGPE